MKVRRRHGKLPKTGKSRVTDLTNLTVRCLSDKYCVHALDGNGSYAIGYYGQTYLLMFF